MLSDDEKEEIHKKIRDLKNNQSEFRKIRPRKLVEDEADQKGRFHLIGVVYEFTSLILVSSLGGYFLAKYTDTQPWTMLASMFLGFVYAFYRLYHSVTR